VASQLATALQAGVAHPSARARVLALLGPVTVAAGVVWAILQPYRLTLLHPHGQGFWWLAIEPPLLVAAAGVFFAVAVARPLLADLEEVHGAP
jgi:formate hydrogenlyase subunit 3/multisubunit Na+/H+ antiporter MnhD subunit